MKKILVPCDFSADAVQAYKLAMDLACANQGEVLVLRVIDIPFLYETSLGGMRTPWYDPSLTLKLEDQFRKDYEKLKNIYAEIVAPVSLLIEHGPVTSTILRIIEEQKIDLVVMGTQGAGSNRGFLIGTNTARVIRSSPVPVISLKKAADISTIKNILFATTLELDQTELVSKVKSLQDFFKATLHILLINTPFHFQDDNKSRRALDEFVRHYKIKDYVLTIRNDAHEQEGIINYAAEINADMIAMATHGRGGISHLLYGSIAEDVANIAGCPVWTSILRK